MITPVFEINQDDAFIVFLIRAPFAKVSDAEISINEKEFLFFSKPYFLRLYLPHELNETEESASYDAEKGIFIIKVKKRIVGQNFHDLNLVTKLLTPVGVTSAGGAHVMTEEIQSTAEVIENELENQSPEYFFNQKIDSTFEPTSFSYDFQRNYGFGCQRNQVFSKLQEELWNLVDIIDPDSISVEERKRVTFEQEQLKFNEGHYLADLFDKEELEKYLLVKCPWEQWSSSESNNSLKFNETEIIRLKDLPKRTYLLNQDLIRSVSLSLLDILFAYAYNYRITEGENNVESGWLIAKLSPTLSCLINWNSAREVCLTCFRRSLCFPLFRHWDLSTKVLDDVKTILKFGKSAVLKCMLDIHGIFSTSGDYRYIFNELYITDYCVWLQYACDIIFKNLYDDLCGINLNKSDVGLELDELELAAELTLSEVGENQLKPDYSIKSESDLLTNIKMSMQNSKEKPVDSDDDLNNVDSDDDFDNELDIIRERVKDMKIIADKEKL